MCRIWQCPQFSVVRTVGILLTVKGSIHQSGNKPIFDEKLARQCRTDLWVIDQVWCFPALRANAHWLWQWKTNRACPPRLSTALHPDAININIFSPTWKHLSICRGLPCIEEERIVRRPISLLSVTSSSMTAALFAVIVIVKLLCLTPCALEAEHWLCASLIA